VSSINKKTNEIDTNRRIIGFSNKGLKLFDIEKILLKSGYYLENNKRVDIKDTSKIITSFLIDEIPQKTILNIIFKGVYLMSECDTLKVFVGGFNTTVKFYDTKMLDFWSLYNRIFNIKGFPLYYEYIIRIIR
jgi:hypothetical protein